MPESKWDLEEPFKHFHAFMLIFTGESHENFCISCFHFAYAVLRSTNLVFGLAQNFHVVFPRGGYTWWWERVLPVFEL